MALTVQEQAQLAQYRAAYADLISGKQIAEVTTNGRSVKFSQANLGKLEAEISRLDAAAANCAPIRRRGAVGFHL